MRDIPVVLSGYKLTVVEPPAPKTRTDDNGAQVPVTDRHGVTQFVVSVFAKLRVGPGERAPKGEEIKVTLLTDPASIDAFAADYQRKNPARTRPLPSSDDELQRVILAAEPTRRAAVVTPDPLVGLDGELTAKQQELLGAVLDAPSVSAAAAALGMSRSNVYAGLRRIGRKVGITDVSELLRLLRAGRLTASPGGR